MDNKITKKRLSDFLSYDWILTIILIAVAIIVWELIFTVSATRIKTGQQFKYYIDQNVTESTNSEFYASMEFSPNKNGKVFSYDVIEFTYEALNSEYNVLSVRLSVGEGDAIFTDCAEKEGEKVRAKEIIDFNSVYALDDLYSDAVNYLEQYLTGGEVDEEKVESVFNERTAKDKRFRSKENRAEGVELEIERIIKLKKEVEDFRTVLNCGEQDLFYNYTKYQQASKDSSDYDEILKTQTEKRYGLNLGAIEASKYFRFKGTDSAEDVVMLIFDFKDDQPDLQYETISFFNAVIRECSDILG